MERYSNIIMRKAWTRINNVRAFSINESSSAIGKVMYRNDSCYGSGVIDLRKIIKYEVCELGNTDIFRYCVDNYKLSKELKTSLTKLSDDIEIDNLIINDSGDSNMIKYVDLLITKLITEISTLIGKMIKYGVWLAELSAVTELYSDEDSDSDIMEYETSDVILSDLGHDGKLFAYDVYPNSREYTGNK